MMAAFVFIQASVSGGWDALRTLHGALHAGASPAAIAGTLDEIAGMVPPDDADRHRLLWARVRGAADVH